VSRVGYYQWATRPASVTARRRASVPCGTGAAAVGVVTALVSPAGFSAARLLDPIPTPVDVSRWVLREDSAGGVNHALACQRVEDGLRRLRAERQQLIVLLIDLGLAPDHDGGDLLGAVMARLAAATRATDTVTRLARGRIVLVVEGVSCGVPPLVDVLRDRCERVFARPVHRRGMRVTVRPRVGAAIAVAGAAMSAERLLAQAEAAMRAKEATGWAPPAASKTPLRPQHP